MPVHELGLEPFTPRHYATLSSWFEDQSELTQWGGSAVRYPLDAAQMKTMLPAPPHRLAWMAARGSDIVGHAQLTAIDRGTGIARLGRIAIAPARRGQRLAVPMLKLVLEQTFSIRGIQRVDLGVYTWNARAIRTYSRLGFTPGEVRTASVRVATGLGPAGDVASACGFS